MRTSVIKNPKVYSSNMYYIRGDWNKIDDVNTIIDPGMDDYIISAIIDIPSGIAKSKVEQVIITHEHFDHASALKHIIEVYNPPKIIAFNLFKGVNIKAFDGMKIQLGDEDAIIIHTPGHSQDSICIYALQSKVLFSGDTPLFIKSHTSSFTKDYLDSLEKLTKLDINKIYPGHDEPITMYCNEIILKSYEIVKSSKII